MYKQVGISNLYPILGEADKTKTTALAISSGNNIPYYNTNTILNTYKCTHIIC